MKNIKLYKNEKYNNSEIYEEIEEGIYKTKSDNKFGNNEFDYVISLSFEQEPELGEEDSPKYISQYPLEDILDKFLVYVSDFYEELNNASEVICYQEFASDKIAAIRSLKSIINKHIYNEDCEEDGETYVKLVIE